MFGNAGCPLRGGVNPIRLIQILYTRNPFQKKRNRCDVVLAVATHFLPESGSRVEAMRINFANLKSLIATVESGSNSQ